MPSEEMIWLPGCDEKSFFKLQRSCSFLAVALKRYQSANSD